MELTTPQQPHPVQVVRVAVVGTTVEVALPSGYATRADHGREALSRVSELVEELVRLVQLAPGERVVDVDVAGTGLVGLALALVSGARSRVVVPGNSLRVTVSYSARLDGVSELVDVVDCGDTGLGALGHDVWATDEPVRVLRINAVGDEIAILASASEVIERDRPWILVACPQIESSEAVSRWLEPRGYALRSVASGSLGHIFAPVEGGLAPRPGLSATVRACYGLRDELEKASDRTVDHGGASARRDLKSWQLAHARTVSEIEALKALNDRVREQRDRARARSTRRSQKLADARRRYRRLKRQVREAHAQQAALAASPEQRVGSALVRSVQAPRRLAGFVVRRVRAHARRAWRSRLASEPKTAGVSRSRAQKRGARSRVPRELVDLSTVAESRPVTPDDLERLESRAAASTAMLRTRWRAGQRPKIAAILDDFTRQSFAPECDLQNLHPATWREELELFRPDVLLVESAWRGHEDSWRSVLFRIPEELVGIIEWCRDHEVPTIFWNKEDPVHFERFLDLARWFDHVLTTDIDRVTRYRTLLGHHRVGVMPFAAQPGLQTPVETYGRQRAAAFAGSYYTKYPERMHDLRELVAGVSSVLPTEIFDRNFGTTVPSMTFPAEYHEYVVGVLGPDEVDFAYKGYQLALNLNSVKSSRTMFARRVFELLASNTRTISNNSRGLKTLLGDLVPMSDSREGVRDIVERLMSDRDWSDKRGAAGLRKVLDQHTYTERVRYLMSVATGTPYSRSRSAAAVLSWVRDAREADAFLATLARQSGVRVSAHVVTDDPAAAARLAEHGVAVRGSGCDDSVMLSDLLGSDDRVLAVLDQRDWYGPSYLQDLAAATQYSTAAVIGKVEHCALRSDGDGVPRVVEYEPGRAYRYSEGLALRRAALSRDACTRMSVATAVVPDAAVPSGWSQLGIHRFDYCADGARDVQAARATSSDLDIDLGGDIEELDDLVSGLPGAQEYGACPVLPLEALAETGPATDESPLAAALVDQRYRIVSRLGDGDQGHLPHSGAFSVGGPWPDGVAQFGFSSMGTLPIHLTMSFYGSNGSVLEHASCGEGTLATYQIPAEAAWCRANFEVTGPGVGYVTRLVLGRWDIDPGMQSISAGTSLPADPSGNAFTAGRSRAVESDG